MRNRMSLGMFLWIIIGVVVALSHHHTVTDVSSLLSFLLVILLWPLVLLGVDIQINLGT